MTPFNPTLGIGKHQQIIESQSRMEAYGKGAHPYYVAKGVIEGWPETKYEIDANSNSFTGRLSTQNTPRGIQDILSSNKLQGVMTWSHGGGWGGPYIVHEIWTDLNTYVVSHWAQNTQKTERELFFEFTDSLGFDNYNADLFRNIAILSIEGVRKGHCNSYSSNNLWWTRDSYFSVTDNNNIVKDIIKQKKEELILAEKAESVAIWLQIEAISKQISCSNKDLQEAIKVSCSYGRIKYQLIEQMWKLMLLNEHYQSKKIIDKKQILQIIQKYDQLWKEWKQLKDSNIYCATIYTDLAFLNQEKGSIKELVNLWRYRLTIK